MIVSHLQNNNFYLFHFFFLHIFILYLGDHDFIEFIAFQSILVQVGGRGIETASLIIDSLCTQKSISDGDEFPLLSIIIGRGKGGKIQTLPIYTQAYVEKWYEDTTTLLTMNILCQQTRNDNRPLPDPTTRITHGDKFPLFPKFKRHITGKEKPVSVDDANYDAMEQQLKQQYKIKQKTPKGVSVLWKAIFSKILQWSEDHREQLEEYYTHFTEKLSSYNGRKRCVEDLANKGASIMAIIYRVGWEARSIHTVFDYIYATVPLQKVAGKIISGWLSQNQFEGSDTGGVPPMAEDGYVREMDPDLYSEKRKQINALKKSIFHGYMKQKFGGSVSLGFSTTIGSLLLGGFMKHYSEIKKSFSLKPEIMIQTLVAEREIDPNVESDNDDMNLDSDNSKKIIFWLEEYLTPHFAAADITPEDFEEMCHEVRMSFIHKNAMALPSSALHELRGKFAIDVRPLKKGFELMVKALRLMDTNISNNNKDMNNRLITLETSMISIEQQLITTNTFLSTIMQHFRPNHATELTSGSDETSLSVTDGDGDEEDVITLLDNLPTFSVWWVTQKGFPQSSNNCPINIYINFIMNELVNGHNIDVKNNLAMRTKITKETKAAIDFAKKTKDNEMIVRAKANSKLLRGNHTKFTTKQKQQYDPFKKVFQVINLILDDQKIVMPPYPRISTKQDKDLWIVETKATLGDVLKKHYLKVKEMDPQDERLQTKCTFVKTDLLNYDNNPLFYNASRVINTAIRWHLGGFINLTLLGKYQPMYKMAESILAYYGNTELSDSDDNNDDNHDDDNHDDPDDTNDNRNDENQGDNENHDDANHGDSDDNNDYDHDENHDDLIEEDGSMDLYSNNANNNMGAPDNINDHIDNDDIPDDESRGNNSNDNNSTVSEHFDMMMGDDD